MEQKRPLKSKSRAFAIRIVRLYQHLKTDHQEYVLSKQILRSGTSIGANIAESECAISKKDFLSKIYTALKECNETLYWLDLLHDTAFLNDTEYTSLYQDGTELRKMLTATTKTTVFRLNDSQLSSLNSHLSSSDEGAK